jgi:phenylacetate-CoA ligase
VHNQWVTSEAGCLAYSCFAGDGLHISEDLAIVEPVDDNGSPTPPGQTSSKVYMTNLFNAVLPLIRFEITDQVTPREGACGCGSAHRWIADIEGRLDDMFTYAGGVSVHPLVFRAVLGQTPTIVEYQVRQTAHGAEVSYLSSVDVPVPRLSEQLSAALARAGLANPMVSFAHVREFERLPTGKVKRFIQQR